MAAFVKRITYPAHLRHAGVGEIFLVHVLFDASGRVLSVRTPESKQPLLVQTVVEAVRATQWTPALKNQKSIPARIVFPVNFVAGP